MAFFVIEDQQIITKARIGVCEGDNLIDILAQCYDAVNVEFPDDSEIVITIDKILGDGEFEITVKDITNGEI